MQVFVNQEARITSPRATLQHLLSELELKSLTGIAVAVNNLVISKSIWAETSLAENDKITIITATAGG